MVHVRLPYRILLTIGILVLLAGCAGDGRQGEVDALRQEIADLKKTQADLQATIDGLQAKLRKRWGFKQADDDDPDTKREAVRRIPIDFAPRKGSSVAAVTVIEFADFQCPYCQGAAKVSDQLLQEFPNEVQFFFKHYPIGKHKQALSAAKAAWAAQQQGKFWEMHDLIYGGDIQNLGPDVLRGYAQQLGLDMARFDQDSESAKAAHQVTMDKRLGKAIKIGGTPAFFVNGKKVSNPSPAALRAKVAEEVEAYRARAGRPAPAPEATAVPGAPANGS